MRARLGLLLGLCLAAIAVSAPAAPAAVTTYASCAAAMAANPGAPDSTHAIVVGSTIVDEYCSGIAGAGPRGYLTLNVVGSANYSIRQPFYTATSFTRVRVVGTAAVVGGQTCAASACIDASDMTFSSTVGGSFFGPTMPYGSAAGCGGPNGTANINLTGTNLSVLAGAFVTSGYNAWGSATYSADNQIVDLTANGSCGDEMSATYPLIPLAVSDADLALAPLPDQTVDATSPAGAVVTFDPQASDPGDSTPPVVSCDYASGSVFPLGSTTVTCTASDEDDANSPQTISFVVTVRGALDQASSLATTAQSYGGSYGGQVQAAQASLAAGNATAAANQLRAFQNHVRAQAGKQIPLATANAMLAAAQQIIAVLG